MPSCVSGDLHNVVCIPSSSAPSPSKHLQCPNSAPAASKSTPGFYSPKKNHHARDYKITPAPLSQIIAPTSSKQGLSSLGHLFLIVSQHCVSIHILSYLLGCLFLKQLLCIQNQIQRLILRTKLQHLQVQVSVCTQSNRIYYYNFFIIKFKCWHSKDNKLLII